MSAIRIGGRTALLGALLAAAGACDDPFGPGVRPASFVAVGAGGSHSCGLTADGALYCWGRGANGELGNGTANNFSVPIRVVGADPVLTAVTLGHHHTCALAPDGRAWCWGWNAYGQLGSGSNVGLGVPNLLDTDVLFARISAGAAHTCGLSFSGEAYCWGENSQGQLGTGGTEQAIRPVPVAGGVPFAEISAGGFHTCARTAGGAGYCWGLNHLGQLGTGDARNRLVPTPIAGGIAFTGVSAGNVHSCGITAEGLAYCWGSARFGQMGQGGVFPVDGPDLAVTQPSPVFQQPPGHVVFVSIDAGRDFTCGTDRRFKTQCWGLGLDGQTGRNQLLIQVFPREVFATLDMRFTAVSAGSGSHACAVTDTSGAYCWGTSPWGAIGPAGAFSSQPVRIPAPQ